MSIKVFLDTLGCRLNESEIEQMGRAFRRLGHEVVDTAEDADLCVINTCAVTTDAGRKSRKLIHQAHRQSPDAQIVVTGCYSQIEREKVESIPGVAHVIDNMQKDKLVPELLGIDEENWMDQEPLSRDLAPKEARRTRAFIKVQDGCDNRCTFCVTTIARGAGRSRPMNEIIQEIQDLHAAGYNEAVLSGVHLGSYGRDLDDGSDLKILIQAILDQTTIQRIRISSLEPWDIPENFFDLWYDSRLCRHIHLPLQAGCDRTLKRMARRTRVDAFRQLVHDARRVMPAVGISTDIIVGFPGETDEDFEESLAFVQEMNFCHMHVFRYSPRPGTAAARMPDHVEKSVKQIRSAAMQELADQGRKAFYKNALHQTCEVLWEQSMEKADGTLWWQGLTDHYIRVQAPAPRNLHNHILPVRLESIGTNGMVEGHLL